MISTQKKNIGCGYSLEASRRDASNEYHNLCFCTEIRNILISMSLLSRLYKQRQYCNGMIWITYVIFKATHNLIYQGDDMDLRDTCPDKSTLSSKRATKTQIGLSFRTTRSRVVYTFLLLIVSLNRRKKKPGTNRVH